jgi:C1A family cysteine protease
LHDYFDYQDYEYIDKSLKTCGDHINWVEKGKVSDPKQQNTCGSCWAHSTIASIETLHAQIKNEAYPNITTFSE